MNERILELWSQAGGHYNNGNQHTWAQYMIDDPKKFAELIVRECMSYMENGDIDFAKFMIKKHFGVER